MSIRFNSVTWYRIGDKIIPGKIRPLLIKFNKKDDAFKFYNDKNLHPSNTLVTLDRTKAQRLQYNQFKNEMNLYNANFTNNKKFIKFIDGEPVLVNQNQQPLTQQAQLPPSKPSAFSSAPVRPNKRNNQGVIIREISSIHAPNEEFLPNITSYKSSYNSKQNNNAPTSLNSNINLNYNTGGNIPYSNSLEHQVQVSNGYTQKRGPGRPKKLEANFNGSNDPRPLDAPCHTDSQHSLALSQSKNFQGQSQRKRQRTR